MWQFTYLHLADESIYSTVVLLFVPVKIDPSDVIGLSRVTRALMEKNLLINAPISAIKGLISITEYL